jgi:hypothetical protein
LKKNIAENDLVYVLTEIDSRSGAQYLLHLKTAAFNGRLERYTGHHSLPADMAA